MTRIANATTETEEHEEVEITPEMIEAGEIELHLFDRDFEDDRDAVVRIYAAMRKAAISKLKWALLNFEWMNFARRGGRFGATVRG
jgi:hypothetical protein